MYGSDWHMKSMLGHAREYIEIFCEFFDDPDLWIWLPAFFRECKTVFRARRLGHNGALFRKRKAMSGTVFPDTNGNLSFYYAFS